MLERDVLLLCQRHRLSAGQVQVSVCVRHQMVPQSGGSQTLRRHGREKTLEGSDRRRGEELRQWSRPRRGGHSSVDHECQGGQAKELARRKYTAKRKKKASATVLVTPVVTQYTVSPVTESTEPAPKRRGRRKKSETTPLPVTVVVEMKPPLLSPSSSQSSSSSTALSQEALPVNLIDQL